MGELVLNNVRQFPGRLARNGGPPHNGDMEARVKQLETDVSAIKETLNAVERDVAVIKSNYATRADIMATKADIAEAKNSIIMWVVSAILLAQLLPSLLKKFGL